ncbi:MAG: hypothetical protein CMJ24_06720 [Phycisphaerae bacterium]|nr:hypothetical protein [Phycisphaerae bacterium]
MEISMAGNEHLIVILQKLLDSHEAQDQWLRGDSDFDDQSKRIMVELVAGQKACAVEFLDWVRGLEIELPISLVAEEGQPEGWSMEWDGSMCEGMSERDFDMLDAIRYIVFNGESYRPDNAVIDPLLGRGMPGRLRKDVEQS